MEGFEWVLEIKDGMSGPAAHMRTSLKGLEAELRTTEAEIRNVQRSLLAQQQAGNKFAAAVTAGTLKGLRLEAAETRAQFRELKTATDEAAPSMFESMLSADLLSAGLAGVAHLALSAATEVLSLARSGLELAISAGEAREHLTRMFSGLGGGSEAGEAMYATIQRMRKVVPESEAEISHWASTLMAAGMTDPARVEASLRAMASASALMGGGEAGGEAGSKIQNLIARSLETGKFKGLGKTLIGTGLSAKDLADQLGMSEANFQAAFKSGTISAERGIAAMNAALTSKGAGALAGTMGELPTILSKAKEAFTHLFDGVDMTPLVDELRDFVGLLDASKPSGQALGQIMSQTFSDMAKSGGSIVRSLKLGFLDLEIAWLETDQSINFGAIIDGAKAFLNVIRDAVRVIDKIADVWSTTIGAVVSLTIRTWGMLAYAGSDALANEGARIRAIYGTTLPAHADGGVQPAHGTTLPAHADGGVVQPAHGEVLASVAPGETIVPRGKLSVGGGGGDGASAVGGTHHTSVDVGGIHIDGAGKSAGEIVAMLESALADVFDRAAMEAGA